MRMLPSAIFFVAPLLCACAMQNEASVSAADLDPILVSQAGNPANNNLNYVGLVLNDSERKCGAFLNGLTLTENGVNTGLDMANTVFSALGTAFTPLAIVHAMTAGATITGGWRTAINADIYGKATAGTFSHAIQSTYYTDLNSYVGTLGKMSQLTASMEVAKIRSIHNECSLEAARATIDAALQPSGATQTGAEGSKPSAPAVQPPPAPAPPPFAAVRPPGRAISPAEVTANPETTGVTPGHRP